MANPFLQQKYREFLEDLESKSIYELTNIFNRETSYSGWTSVRASFLQALRDSFISRGVDISDIRVEGGYSYRHQAFYDEHKHKLVAVKSID